MANYSDVAYSPIKWLSNNRSYSELEMITVKCSHTWTIKNFSFSTECLQSPDFFNQPESDCKFKWYLKLHPHGVTKETSNYISLFLFTRRINCQKPVFVKYDFSLLNSSEQLIRQLSGESLFRQEAFNSHGFGEFIEKNDTLKIVLPGDQLTIHCEVIYSFESRYVSYPERPFCGNRKRYELDTFESMLKFGKFSDVTLRVQGKVFYVHKSILAINSPVFSEMFEQDMDENESNLVDIQDFSSETIGTIVQFMYTFREPVLDFEMAKEVLAASEKYALDDLKSICEDYLASELTVETAADLLCLAFLQDAVDLKRRSLNFIRDHGFEVSKTPSWKLLLDSQPQVLREALEKLVLH